MKKIITLILIFCISCTQTKSIDISKICIIDKVDIVHKYDNLPEIQYVGYSKCNIVYKSNQKINIGDTIKIIYKKIKFFHK